MTPSQNPGGSRHRAAPLTALMAGWLIGMGGCGTPSPALVTYHRLDAPARSDAPTLQPAEYDRLLGDLRNGDVILGVKEDPITAFIRLGTVEPSYFTHSGTIEIDQQPRSDGSSVRTARVWHAIGSFSLLNLSPHALGKVKGRVQSIGLDEFMRRYDVLAIIRLPDERRNELSVGICRRLAEDRTPFDPYFDCRDHRALCCTELTAVAIQWAGYEFDLAPVPRTPRPDVSDLMTGWNVTTDAMYVADQFQGLPGAVTIAVISRYGRMETYLALRDAALLLHARVAAGEIQPSALCGFDHRRLDHYSPRMELFLRGVEGLAKASPTLDLTQIRRRNEIVYEATIGARSP